MARYSLGRDERESTKTIRQTSLRVFDWFVRVLPDALCANDCASVLGFRGKTRFANVSTNSYYGVANGDECHRIARHVLDMAMDGIESNTSRDHTR